MTIYMEFKFNVIVQWPLEKVWPSEELESIPVFSRVTKTLRCHSIVCNRLWHYDIMVFFGNILHKFTENMTTCAGSWHPPVYLRKNMPVLKGNSSKNQGVLNVDFFHEINNHPIDFTAKINVGFKCWFLHEINNYPIYLAVGWGGAASTCGG